jgi:hypothetical protein
MGHFASVSGREGGREGVRQASKRWKNISRRCKSKERREYDREKSKVADFREGWRKGGSPGM